MKVFPDTTLKILTGCPCDPDYEHTLYFANETAQRNYFSSIAKYTVNDMSYQRAKRGRIRVQYKVENLYDCNYIMFQNTAFGDKWFYAFIDDVTYVNNITSEISYTIDVMQTWLFDMQLQQCFVEREHSVTDVAGDNRIAENLDIGDMVMFDNLRSVMNLAEVRPLIVVVKGTTAVGGAYDPGFYGNTFSTCVYQSFEANEQGAKEIADWLSSVGFWDNPQAVVSIFMTLSNLGINKSATPFNATREETVLDANPLRRADGSLVKNQKLNTFPYTFLRLTNMSGQTHDYMYELFADRENGIKFESYYSYSDKLSVTFAPKAYKSLLNTEVGVVPDESITYSAFPVCSYAVTDFARRIALGGISAVLSALTVGAGAGAGTLLASAALGGASAALSGSPSVTTFEAKKSQTVAERYAETGVLSNEDTSTPSLTKNQANVLASMAGGARPLTLSVSAGSGTDFFNGGLVGVRYAQMCPTKEYITKIDDYFSRYGYKTNAIKVPNISSRPHWNYTQTVGCKIGGSIPCQDEKLICAIFDHGVTFWKNPGEVGNYSLDNSPV